MTLCAKCLNPGCDGKQCLLNKHLFVYGTLKKGRSNHRLLEAATFIGPAVSLGTNFVMDRICVNEVEDGPSAPVKGELYLVPTAREWLRLDRLESHPHVYRRKIRNFLTPADGKQYDAWIYMWEPVYRTRGHGIEFAAEYLNPKGQLEF